MVIILGAVLALAVAAMAKPIMVASTTEARYAACMGAIAVASLAETISICVRQGQVCRVDFLVAAVFTVL